MDNLKQIIKKLQQDLLDSNSGLEIQRLKQENSYLKQRLDNGPVQRQGGAIEYDNLIRKKNEIENELDYQKQYNQQQIKKLNSQAEKYENELITKKNEIFQLRQDLSNNSIISNANYKNQNDNEIAQSRKQLIKQAKQIESQSQEIELLKQNDKRQKIRINQLENDLKQALKTAKNKVSARLYPNYLSQGSRNGGSSPGSSIKSFNSIKSDQNVKRQPIKGGSQKSGGSLKQPIQRQQISKPVVSKSPISRQPISRQPLYKKPQVPSNRQPLVPSNRQPLSQNKKQPLQKQNYVQNYVQQYKKTAEIQRQNNLLKQKQQSGRPQQKQNLGIYGQMIGKNSDSSKNSSVKGYSKEKSIGRNQNKVNNKFDYDEQRLMKRLDDLKNKNKQQVKPTFDKKLYGDDYAGVLDIDSRLSKLQNLLKQAKN